VTKLIVKHTINKKLMTLGVTFQWNMTTYKLSAEDISKRSKLIYKADQLAASKKLSSNVQRWRVCVFSVNQTQAVLSQSTIQKLESNTKKPYF